MECGFIFDKYAMIFSLCLTVVEIVNGGISTFVILKTDLVSRIFSVYLCHFLSRSGVLNRNFTNNF